MSYRGGKDAARDGMKEEMGCEGGTKRCHIKKRFGGKEMEGRTKSRTIKFGSKDPDSLAENAKKKRHMRFFFLFLLRYIMQNKMHATPHFLLP